MSEEQLNAFLQKVKSDTELQEKLKASADADANAVVAIAKEAGFSITAEDIQSMQSSTVELSDEELEGAAGGMKAPACWENSLCGVRTGQAYGNSNKVW